MEKITLGLYAICHKLPEDKVDNGAPFIAPSDDHAKKMVFESVKDHIDKLDVSTFDLVRLGTFDPDAVRPVILRKGAPKVVSNVGDLVASARFVMDVKKSEVTPVE